MNLPKHIADIIKPAPEGFAWVYRGSGWFNRTPTTYVIFFSLRNAMSGYEDAFEGVKKRANGFAEYEYIELVEVKSIRPDLSTVENQLEYAKTLIGKRVKSNRDISVYSENGYPTGWEVAGYKFVDFNNTNYRNRSVELSLDKGWSVAVYMTNDNSLLPVEFVELVPESKTIKLTDEYDATIYKNKVVVGCQTISKEKLCEVMLEMEKL